MPRNSSGNYVLPSGNPVVADTLIESAWANLTMSDLAEALTDSLDRNGRGGMLAPFRLADGVLLEPGLSFANEPSLGLLRGGANDMRATVLGVPRMRWTAVAGTQNWDGSAWRTLAEGAYREVTETQTDTTADRLLKVGDFGLGAAIVPLVGPDVSSLDARAGVYRFDDRDVTLANRIYSCQGTLLRGSFVAERQTELMLPITNISTGADGYHGGAARAAWRQQGAANVWSNARWLYDNRTIIGPVSQDSGVPTGAIIERGANANGDFVRFADGTQICQLTRSDSVTITAQGNVFAGESNAWTFPATFSIIPWLIVSPQATTMFVGGIAATGTSSMRARLFGTAALSSANVAMRYLAIGRWF